MQYSLLVFEIGFTGPVISRMAPGPVISRMALIGGGWEGVGWGGGVGGKPKAVKHCH